MEKESRAMTKRLRTGDYIEIPLKGEPRLPDYLVVAVGSFHLVKAWDLSRGDRGFRPRRYTLSLEGNSEDWWEISEETYEYVRSQLIEGVEDA